MSPSLCLLCCVKGFDLCACSSIGVTFPCLFWVTCVLLLCLRACVRACVHACVRACVRALQSARRTSVALVCSSFSFRAGPRAARAKAAAANICSFIVEQARLHTSGDIMSPKKKQKKVDPPPVEEMSDDGLVQETESEVPSEEREEPEESEAASEKEESDDGFDDLGRACNN